ncbi:TPA: hypothetical protein ACKS42_001046 [Streptococcus pyogenes]
MNIEEAKRAIRELDASAQEPSLTDIELNSHASAQEPAMALWGWTEIKK